MAFETEQEKLWHGEFGNDYVDRNKSNEMYVGKIAMYSQILLRMQKFASLVEFGANIGLNLDALKQLNPSAEYAAVEINNKACNELRRKNYETYEESILEFSADKTFDVVLLNGVLIHIAPEALPRVYDKMYQYSKRYVIIAEYFSKEPRSIVYRGNKDALFLRDFAGEFLERFNDCRLVDYGFTYSKDTRFGYDDINWFIIEKTK